MKVMVVDDSGTMRAILKRTLQECGITQLVEAENGVDCIKKVAAEKPNVIFLDWNMPKLSGIAVLKKLKADPATRDIRIIMVTSEAERSQIMDAVSSGAADYVVKPFTPEIIRNKVAAFIAPKPTETVGKPTEAVGTPTETAGPKTA